MFRFGFGLGSVAVLTVLVSGDSCCCCGGGCASAAKSSFCYGNVGILYRKLATKVHVPHCRCNLCSMLSSCSRDFVPGLWQVTYLAVDGAIDYFERVDKHKDVRIMACGITT